MGGMGSRAADINRRRRARDAAANRPAEHLRRRLAGGCLLATLLPVVLVSLLAAAVSGAALLFLRGLPDTAALADLPQRYAPQPGVTQLIAPDGDNPPLVLDVVSDPRLAAGGWRPLDDHSPYLVEALVALEDPAFHTRPRPSLRRALDDVRAGRPIDEPVSPLVQSLIDAELRDGTEADGERRALEDWVLGWQIGRDLSPDDILETTLNSRYYGNLAYGAAAAAGVYFGKPVDDLSLNEAALLAALAGNHADNPFDDPAGAVAATRRALSAMVAAGMISPDEAATAAAQPLALAPPPGSDAAAPAFARLVRDELARVLGPERLLPGGLTVETTLDPSLQAQVDCLTAALPELLRGREPVIPAGGHPACPALDYLPAIEPLQAAPADAAVVIIDPRSGEVRAMTGGLEPRPSGTLIRPFIYLTALSQGYNAASQVLDLPPETDADTDWGDWLGPLRLRTALAADRDEPARQVLGWVGAAATLETARALDLPWTATTAITADNGPPATLLDLSAAFGTLANFGTQAGAPGPITIRRVLDAAGQVVYEHQTAARDILTPGLAFLLNDILSDDDARCLGRCPAGLPTTGGGMAIARGESRDSADTWTIGYSPDLVIGVWAGADETDAAAAGSRRTGPLWTALMGYADAQGLTDAAAWQHPAGVRQIDVCALSGLLPALPGEGIARCPSVGEWFISGIEPTAVDRSTVEVTINRETGRLATQFTPPRMLETRRYSVYPAEAQAWAAATGIEQPPTMYDTLRNIPTTISGRASIETPEPFETVSGEIVIRGIATGEGFSGYRLAYFPGLLPEAIRVIAENEQPIDAPGELGRWDTAGLDGLYTLLLTVFRADGTFDEIAVPLTVGP